jgi:hypothetical protein
LCIIIEVALGVKQKEESYYRQVNFSRLAKRRAKLCDIPELTIEEILVGLELHNGEHELIKEVPGFKYPIKIVVSVEE